MQEEDARLTAVVTTTPDGLDAKLLEIDIAAHAASVEELLKEFGHAIVVTYDMDKHFGDTPFIGILIPMSVAEERGIKMSTVLMGYIALPPHVGEALAAALRLRKPIAGIEIFSRAA